MQCRHNTFDFSMGRGALMYTVTAYDVERFTYVRLQLLPSHETEGQYFMRFFLM